MGGAQPSLRARQRSFDGRALPLLSRREVDDPLADGHGQQAGEDAAGPDTKLLPVQSLRGIWRIHASGISRSFLTVGKPRPLGGGDQEDSWGSGLALNRSGIEPQTFVNFQRHGLLSRRGRRDRRKGDERE